MTSSFFLQRFLLPVGKVEILPDNTPIPQSIPSTPPQITGFARLELAALAASTVGAIASLAFGQASYAIPPLSLSLGLSCLNRNRERLEAKDEFVHQAEFVEQARIEGATRLELQRLSDRFETLERSTVEQLNALRSELEQPATSSEEAGIVPFCRGRVALFIDSANLEHSARHLGIERINYRALLEIFSERATALTGAWLYIGVDASNSKQQGFLHCLRHMGYNIVEKAIAYRPDGSRKANIDVELALDLVALANSYDTAVLVSGDSDFRTAVERVKSQGKVVEVVGCQRATSKALIEAADRYIELDTLNADLNLPRCANTNNDDKLPHYS